MQIQRKAIDVFPGEVKVLQEDVGIVEAFVNTTGIVDLQNDVMEPGCFEPCIKAMAAGRSAWPALCWNHDWALTTGKVLSLEEIPPGDPRLPPRIREMGGGALRMRAQYNLETQRGREAYSDVKFGAIRQWSIGFYPVDDTVRYDEKGVRHIGRVAELAEISNVLVGASPGTHVVGVKGLVAPRSRERWRKAIAILAKAVWSTAFVNDLPDSAFAYIAPGGEKDEEGKTVPRSLRYFPHHGPDGKPDEAHVRNALARIPQSNLSDAAKAKALAHVRAHAKKLGIEVEEDGKSAADETAHTDIRTHVHEHADGTKHAHPHAHAEGEPDHDHEAHGHKSAGEGLEHKDGLELPELQGDEAQHNAPLRAAIQAIKDLIRQELEEDEEEPDCVQRLVSIWRALLDYALAENSEEAYSALVADSVECKNVAELDAPPVSDTKPIDDRMWLAVANTVAQLLPSLMPRLAEPTRVP